MIKLFFYTPINDTPFELPVHAFWPSDIERLIKLTFSESISLPLKIKPMTLLKMTLLNKLQETSNVPA